MSRRYFGTDGVRGVANDTLKPELAFSLGFAAGTYFRKQGSLGVVIGRDTRRSGPMLEAALAAGFASAGMDSVSIGVAPTPTVSYVARTQDFVLGAIVSASHNPAPDNGIKFVGHDGRKLSDDVEVELEAIAAEIPGSRVTGPEVGSIKQDVAPLEEYLNYIEAIVPEKLKGLRVAVDAANGAAYHLGPEILRRLGADVVIMANKPDGMNINAHCGATEPDAIQKFTVETESDIGVSFDGDADRAVFSDEKGRLINGDRMIGIWAGHHKRAGELNPAVVVGTVMSNGGFAEYLTREGIKLERTPVGDKYVSQRIAETGAHIGGEQSGHIVIPRRGPTGDGLVTMLELLRVLRVEGRKTSEFYEDYEPWPQLLVNVRIAEKDGWKTSAEVQSALEAAERRLEKVGRLVVRASGTQPMVRVMVEANESGLRDEAADSIVEALVKHAGGEIYSRVDLTYALGD